MKRCSRCRKVKPQSEFYGKQNNCKPCHTFYTTQWRKNHPKEDRIIQLRSLRKPSNRLKRYERTAAWKKRNALSNSAHARAYYARLKNAPGSCSELQLAARSAMYGDRCWLCSAFDAPIMDHVKPLSRGGSNWPANRRPICPTCNTLKKNRWPFDQQAYRKLIAVESVW